MFREISGMGRNAPWKATKESAREGGWGKLTLDAWKVFGMPWKKFSHILLTIKCNCWRGEDEEAAKAALETVAEAAGKAEVAEDDPETKVATYA